MKFSRSSLASLILGVSLHLLSPLHAAEPVVASLVIPPAETHVIGDPIPLLWRFANQGNQPLAFMWEGCCRQNGRLEVSRAGESIPLIPPTQALAHMFAKAERLLPAQPRDFETRLSDWVHLEQTGEYELAGHYTGVLPQQQPQVPRGTELWREAVATSPVKIAVVSVADYWQQRAQRAQQRGLSLHVSGADKLPPLQPITWSVEFYNTDTAPQKILWPQDVRLWVVSSSAKRLENVPAVLDVPSEELIIAPGEKLTRTFPLTAGHMENEPLGDYQVFLDLAASGDKPRVPSTTAPLQWKLTAADVTQLVQAAATGNRAALRNAPLKLLRVYLADAQPALKTISDQSLPAPAANLVKELRLASCLKPLAPLPGQVKLLATVEPSGRWSFQAPELSACADSATDPLAQLKQALSVRRHLGWEISVELQPQPATTLITLSTVAHSLNPLRAELASGAFATPASVSTNTLSRITFPAEVAPGNLIFRVTPSSSGMKLSYARRLPDPQQPQRPNLIPANEVLTQSYQPLETTDALATLLADQQLPNPQILVIVDGYLKWIDLVKILQPVWERGWSVEIMNIL